MDILRKYFSGQLSTMEEAQVQDWLLDHADDPEVVRALDVIISEFQSENPDLSKAAFAAVCSRLGIRTDRRRRIVRKMILWTARVAACLLFVVLGAAGYAVLYPQPQVEWLEMKVPTGQTGELTLADGTHLHLNAGSRITYPSEFTSDQRRVFIEGEVYAEVVKDEERPFMITAGDVDVKVLGTTFNFKSYDNAERVELLLLDGSVEMGINTNGRNRRLSLRPGEMIQYDRKSGEVDLRRFNSLSFRGFHENRAIHFFNLSLSDIMADLERLYGTKLILLDESLANTRYFALFTNNESLDQILKGVDMDGKMKFIRKDGVIYISRK